MSTYVCMRCGKRYRMVGASRVCPACHELDRTATERACVVCRETKPIGRYKQYKSGLRDTVCKTCREARRSNGRGMQRLNAWRAMLGLRPVDGHGHVEPWPMRERA
jgi:hypothetical protein